MFCPSTPDLMEIGMGTRKPAELEVAFSQNLANYKTSSSLSLPLSLCTFLYLSIVFSVTVLIIALAYT